MAKSMLARYKYSPDAKSVKVDFYDIASSMFMYNERYGEWFSYSDGRCKLSVNSGHNSTTNIIFQVNYPVHNGNIQLVSEEKILAYFTDDDPGYRNCVDTPKEYDSNIGGHLYDKMIRYSLTYYGPANIEVRSYVYICYKDIQPDGNCSIDAWMENVYVFQDNDSERECDCLGFFLELIMNHYDKSDSVELEGECPDYDDIDE